MTNKQIAINIVKAMVDVKAQIEGANKNINSYIDGSIKFKDKDNKMIAINDQQLRLAKNTGRLEMLEWVVSMLAEELKEE